MFDSLSGRLGEVFERLTKRGVLSEGDVEAALTEVRVALPNRFALRHRVRRPVDDSPSDTIRDHGDKRDDDPGKQALTELGFPQTLHDFPADISVGADDRGEDDHAEAGHNGLVDPDHDRGQRERNPHPPRRP